MSKSLLWLLMLALLALWVSNTMEFTFNDSGITDAVNNLTALKNSTSNLTYAIYPNYNLTYGGVTSTNLTEICNVGYSSTIRNVSQSTREAVFAEYNISYPQPTGTTELDHFYALEISGNNFPSNLWVQWSDKIVGAGKGFESKDKLENYLHRQMCAGNITQQQAFDSTRNDWVAAYQECCTS